MNLRITSYDLRLKIFLKMKKAIVLLSGGLDSTTVLAIAKNLGFEIYALSFEYGQRHKIELESAKKIAKNFEVKEHKIAKIDLRIFGGSALTDEIEVPKIFKNPPTPPLGGKSRMRVDFMADEISSLRRFFKHPLSIVLKILYLFRATCYVLRASWIKITEARCTKHEARNIPDTKFCLITTLSPFRGKSRMRVDFMADEISSLRIPVTYVPARNTIFLSYALAYGEVIGAFDIFIGVNAVDYSGYPDCRPEFIQTFEKLANLATAAGIEKKGQFKIHTPLIEMSKKEIIESGIKLGIDYSQTHSCYDPVIKNGEIIACKECDSCRLRLDGFNAANTSDPIKYA